LTLRLRRRLALRLRLICRMLRSRRAFVRLRSRTTWLRLRSYFALRWRLISRALLRLRPRLALLRLRSCLPLVRLRISLALPRLRPRLTLARLRISLALVRLRISLALPRLRPCLPLIRLRSAFALPRLRPRLTLPRLWSCLVLLLLLLLYIPIGCPQCRWNFHVVIGWQRLIDGHTSRAAMVRIGKLSPVGAGCMLILHLSPHRCSVRLIHRHPLRGPRRDPYTTRSAVETYMVVVCVIDDRVVIDVVHDRDIYVVDRAVVVEVPAAPVAALVAVACVAKAVIDAAVVADVLAPVATVEPVRVIPVAPVAGRPKCSLVGSLNPCAGHPIIAVRRPGPVAGRPDVVVAGIVRLVVVGQWRRRLICRVFRLLSVTGIVGRLVGRLIRGAALVGRRPLLVGPLLVAGCGRWTLLRA